MQHDTVGPLRICGDATDDRSLEEITIKSGGPPTAAPSPRPASGVRVG
jgi:hypothetical protein